MEEQLQAIATLFSLVNPVVCAMMFSAASHGQAQVAAFREATLAMLTVGAVLAVAAFAGSPILRVFGISLDAFSVAGGGVLIFIGLLMLSGSNSPSTPNAAAVGAEGASRLGPLILFAASPGTITGVITIVAAHRRDGIPVTALVAIAAVLTLTWIMLLAASAVGGGNTHRSLARDMVSRYMGLIIIAMGIQFALSGYKSFMSG